MMVDGDRAARAVTNAWQLLVAALAGGWALRQDGALAAVTTVRFPALNGVWADEVDADRGAVTLLLDRVAGTGLPHCLQMRPECEQSLAEVAAQRGMTPDEDVPLMVLQDSDGLGDPGPRDLMIRRLGAPEADLHARLAAAGFEAPEEHLRQLITPGVLSRPGVCGYIGEVAGEPVSTGLGVTVGDWVGVFNVATPPAHRRHGYGAAITARAVGDGLSSGARWAWLESSSAGCSVYQRLESWHCWLAAGA